MLPIKTLPDLVDQRNVDGEQSRKEMSACAERVEGANFEHLIFGQPALTVARTYGFGPVEDLVSLVSLPSQPTQISGGIVERIAIPVRSIVPMGGSRAMERCADQNVDWAWFSGSEHHHEVIAARTSFRRAQRPASQPLVPAILVDDDPIYGSDIAAAAGLVARVTGNVAPFFHARDHITAQW